MTRRITFWEPRGALTADLLVDMLGLVSLAAPIEVVQEWTEFERLLAYDWAAREHLRASDNIVRRRPRPWLLGVAKPVDYFVVDPANRKIS